MVRKLSLVHGRSFALLRRQSTLPTELCPRGARRLAFRRQADKWLAKVHALAGVLRVWFASLRLLTDGLLRFRAGSPLYQLSCVPVVCHKLCGYQEEVKDDAPSFSFFQNIVSKEQSDDKSSLALNHTGMRRRKNDDRERHVLP